MTDTVTPKVPRVVVTGLARLGPAGLRRTNIGDVRAILVGTT